MELTLPQLADSLLSSYMETMKLSTYGVALLDDQGNIFRANPLAQEMLCGDGIQLKNNQLLAADCNDQKQLYKLIQETINNTNPEPTKELLLNRPSGKRPYIIMCSGLRFPELTEGITPAAILIIHDPDHQQTLPLERIQARFGLTNSESLVARAIMQGQSLQQCAAEIGHSVCTSRNLLKRVYLKTGTKRQNELASLLLQSPLGFSNPFELSAPSASINNSEVLLNKQATN